MNKAKISDIKITQRIRKDVAKIEELAADIERVGLLNPVTVMKDEAGELKLLAGLRRLKAAQFIGWTEININTVAPTDAEEALRIEISENEQRESFTFSEKMDYARLLEEIEQAKAKERMAHGGKGGVNSEGVDPGPPLQKKKSRDAIGEKIGISGRQYDRAKFIVDNAPPEIIEQLDKDERAIRTTYDELRAKEKSVKSSDTNEAHDPSKSLQPVSRVLKPLSKEDEEAQRKINEFNILSPSKKVEILQEQLRKERARAAEAESELKRERELHHNTNYHSQLSIANLEGQVAALTTKVAELAKALMLDVKE